jgi:uncharacterized protein YkwD
VNTTTRRTFAAVTAVLVLAVAACGSPESNQAATMLNQYRARNNRAALARSAELDVKAQGQARAMANAGRIFHSPNLATGVSPGWMLIGENVAVAGAVTEAQRALEGSAPHRSNMLNSAFTEMGIGVTSKSGRVYLVQVFVQR